MHSSSTSRQHISSRRRQARPMPHCFEIPEILLHVFEHVYLSTDGRVGLARLALTCKLFSGPALDVLWRVQTSLLPFLRTFPPELLSLAPSEQMAVATFTIVKKPMISQWRRPLLYAKRIRTIIPETTLRSFGGIAVHKSVLQMLVQSCPSKPLFPNLQELSYPTICNISVLDETTYIKSLFLLSAPNALQTLSFQYPGGRSVKDTGNFLTQFRNHFRALEFLRVFMDDVPVEITEFLSVFASLKTLKCFVLALGPDFSFSAKRKGLHLSDAFSGLRSLGLHSFSTPFVLQLLKAIQPSRLEIINIHLASKVSPEKLAELFGSVVSLAGQRQSVRLLSLTTSGYTSALQSIGDLLTLRHLRHLSLYNTGLALDDHKLDEMARAWPTLQHLSILNDAPPSTTTCPTLQSLGSLARHCPYIEVIELGLNACEIPPLAQPFTSLRRGHGAKPVVLGIDVRSWMEDSAGIASFLLGTYPGISVKPIGLTRDTSSWNKVAKIVDETLGRRRPQPRTSVKGPHVMYMA